MNPLCFFSSRRRHTRFDCDWSSDVCSSDLNRCARGDERFMRILFVASEGLPFSKTGGLADVVEALPKALVAGGHEVAVVLPRYRGTKATAVLMPSLTIPMGGNRLRFPAIADGAQLNGVRYYFVDDPEYFDRDGLYGSSIAEYPDNPERYAEFCRAAIEVAKHVWPADVIRSEEHTSELQSQSNLVCRLLLEK